MDMITKFRDEYRFLSNFYPAPIKYNEAMFATSEHLYQYLKVTDPETKHLIWLADTPGKAKRLGRTKKIQENWKDISINVMYNIVKMKFEQHPDLTTKLIETGDARLVEGNSWGDTFWGECPIGTGRNHLGEILMAIRKEMKESRHVHKKANRRHY